MPESRGNERLEVPLGVEPPPVGVVGGFEPAVEEEGVVVEEGEGGGGGGLESDDDVDDDDWGVAGAFMGDPFVIGEALLGRLPAGVGEGGLIICFLVDDLPLLCSSSNTILACAGEFLFTRLFKSSFSILLSFNCSSTSDRALFTLPPLSTRTRTPLLLLLLGLTRLDAPPPLLLLLLLVSRLLLVLKLAPALLALGDATGNGLLLRLSGEGPLFEDRGEGCGFLKKLSGSLLRISDLLSFV
jgi:hypothetical protein